MAINITTIKNFNDINDVAVFVNTSASGNFFGILLIGLLIIFFIRLFPSGNVKAFTAANFGIFILSLFLLNNNLVAIYYPVLFSLSLAGSLLYHVFSNNN